MDETRAKRFITENARPLELAQHRFFFEAGPREDVSQALADYQNPDGGFAHALEPDNWDPLSNPIAVNDALITLCRVGALSGDSPLVQGMVRYLASHASFDEAKRRWLFAVESTAAAPHAVWWEKGTGDGIHGFNPTVSLAAFMVCFGGGGDEYAAILREAFAALHEAKDLGGDEVKCYLLAWSLLHEQGASDIIGLAAEKDVLCKVVENAICKDTAKYGVEYVPLPSDFFPGTYDSFVTLTIRQLITKELAVLDKMQQADGGFDISWQWYNAYPEFAQARRWWRPRITLDKLLFARTYGTND